MCLSLEWILFDGPSGFLGACMKDAVIPVVTW